ncbi:MAG: flagellar basal body-associated FliL family protein [Desulfosarcinaceae bacterium]
MSKKLLIIIIAVVLLVMGIIGGGFFLLWTKMAATMAQVQNPQEEKQAAQEEVKPEEMVTIGPIYKLDTMIVNLADQGGKRYLRITMELELSAPELVEEIDKRLPQLRDAILMILPTKTYAEISTTEGKIALRDELMAKLNSFLKTGTVKTIYFSEFVVQ